MNSENPLSVLATTLVEAHRARQPLNADQVAVVPAEAAHAWAVQAGILERRGGHVAAWKVGSKSLDGPIQGAPLPAEGVHPSGASLLRGAFRPGALELEIAFRFARTFIAGRHYEDADVLGAIDSFGATLEVVASRFIEWPKVEPLLQSADLMSHGALVVAEFVPYRADYPFLSPAARFTYNQRPAFDGPPANPAGDPRRLLPWLVNHCCARGMTLTPDVIVTTGSYCGMFFPDENGVVIGELEGLPPVRLELA